MKEPSLKCVDMVVSELTSTIRKCSEKVKKRKTPRKVNAHPLPTHIGAHTTGPLASPGREEGCGDALKEGSICRQQCRFKAVDQERWALAGGLFG